MNENYYEDNKWESSNNKYNAYIQNLDRYFEQIFEYRKIDKGGGITAEIIQNFGAYGGDANIANMLYKYDIYKKVMNLSGDIAEVGIYKGNSFLFWAKLIKLFEARNLTQVYGFDWFEGMKPAAEDDNFQEGKYKASDTLLRDIIKWQELDEIALVFSMNVITEAEKFINERPHLRFKILYIDCGIKEVMEAAYKSFYPRLVHGGILLMDHYNYAVSPTESNIAEQYIGNSKIYQMPFARQPSGYIIKE